MLAVVALLLCGAGYLSLTSRWMVVEDSLDDGTTAVRPIAIAVLNGDTPARAKEAAALYRAQASTEIWLTQFTRDDYPAPIRDAGTTDNCKTLRAESIPLDAVVVFDESARKTLGEVRQIADEVRRRGGTSVILVTSTYDTGRVRLLWRSAVGEFPQAIVRGARTSHSPDSLWEKLKYGEVIRVWFESVGRERRPAPPRAPLIDCRSAVLQ